VFVASLTIPNKQAVKDEPSLGRPESPHIQPVDLSNLGVLDLGLTFEDSPTHDAMTRRAIQETLGRVAALQRLCDTTPSSEPGQLPEAPRDSSAQTGTTEPGQVSKAPGSSFVKTGTIVHLPNAPVLPNSSHQA
jgi:hypothetical protein